MLKIYAHHYSASLRRNSLNWCVFRWIFSHSKVLRYFQELKLMKLLNQNMNYNPVSTWKNKRFLWFNENDFALFKIVFQVSSIDLEPTKYYLLAASRRVLCCEYSKKLNFQKFKIHVSQNKSWPRFTVVCS